VAKNLVKDLPTRIWEVAPSQSIMQLKHGEMVAIPKEKDGYVSVNLATSYGRKITSLTKTHIEINFTFTFTNRVGERK
jgi:hypothetical protein